MTTIINKYGFGEPTPGELKKAEIGVDLTKGYIYSSTDGADIIELGRGEIKWENITDKPPTIDPDGGNYVDLEDLLNRVEENEDDIEVLQTALKALDDQINADGGLVDQIAENVTNISNNATAIKDLEALLNQNLTGLVMGGEYDASNNLVSDTTAAGEAAGLAAGSPLPVGEGTKGLYLVVTTEGVLSGTGGYKKDGSAGRADNDTAHVGDWLVSDGQHGWILFSFGMDAVNWGMIGGKLSNQSDLVAEFENYLKKTDTIDCGTYS